MHIKKQCKYKELFYIIVFINTVIDGIVHGIGKQLVGTPLFFQDFVEHPSVSKQFGLASGAGVVFVVEVLERAGHDAAILKIQIRIVFPSGFHACQLIVQTLNLTRHGFGRHVDNHLFERLIVIEGKHRDFLEGDGVALQGDDQGVNGGCGSVDGDEPPAISDAADPEGVDSFGRDEKGAVAVGDSATVRHFADDMGVSHGNQAVGGHDDAENRKFVVKIQPVFALSEQPQTSEKKDYDE